jgi:AcrR family transcriptional regulator
VHDNSGKDRRVQKTRALLLEALGSLIREKPFDAIVVKEILHRANVGRSTFYTHFRDKDELLVSGIHDMLRQSATTGRFPATRGERIIGFSLPIFEHIDRHRRADGTGAAGWAVVHERLRQVLGDRIAAETAVASSRIPADLLVRYVTSNFIVVLDWWVESRSPLSPAEVDALFRALVLPTLTAALD